MTIIIVLISLLLLIILIAGLKFNAFISFLIVAIVSGSLFGLPAAKILAAVQKGIGDTLGSIVIILVLGAMLGKLVAATGAAQKIADVLMRVFGKRYIQWALMITGFITGISLFYNVGFVLMVPLIFSIAYRFNLSSVFIGLPMLAALSVTHGFLPPHPAPTALVSLLKADVGRTLLYGFIVAIPAVILAGPVFAQTLKRMEAKPLKIFQPTIISAEKLPGAFNSFFTALLPVVLLISATLLQQFGNDSLKSFLVFAGDPVVVMLVAVLFAAWSLGLLQKRNLSSIMEIFGDAVKDIGMLLLIIAGAGALKQVFADSGVNTILSTQLSTLSIHPLILGWGIAAVIRVCIGSATIAGLTTAGFIFPIVQQSQIDPNLMVLAVGAGSLFFSHVNDAGFWMYKEYFNLSMKQTFRSWTIMETIVSVAGLGGVLLLNQFL
jgi:Gnt-I system high-affinity gluconate transporter